MRLTDTHGRTEPRNSNSRYSCFSGVLFAQPPSWKFPVSEDLSRIPDALWDILRSGDYDQLLVDDNAESWPSLVDSLADDVLARLTDAHTWQEAPGIALPPLDDPENTRREVRSDLRRRFFRADSPTCITRTMEAIQACDGLAALGWTRDGSSARYGLEAAFCHVGGDGLDKLEVEWRRGYLQAILMAGIGRRGMRSTTQLFVLSNDHDELVPVDGPPPPHSALDDEGLAALKTALIALRALLRDAGSAEYQQMRNAQA